MTKRLLSATGKKATMSVLPPSLRILTPAAERGSSWRVRPRVRVLPVGLLSWETPRNGSPKRGVVGKAGRRAEVGDRGGADVVIHAVRHPLPEQRGGTGPGRGGRGQEIRDSFQQSRAYFLRRDCEDRDLVGGICAAEARSWHVTQRGAVTAGTVSHLTTS